MQLKRSLGTLLLFSAGIVCAFVYWINNLNNENQEPESKQSFNDLDITESEKTKSQKNSSPILDSKIYTQEITKPIVLANIPTKIKRPKNSTPDIERVSLAVNKDLELRLIRAGANPDLLIKTKKSGEFDL